MTEPPRNFQSFHLSKVFSLKGLWVCVWPWAPSSRIPLFLFSSFPESVFPTCEGGFANRDPNLDFQVATRGPNLDFQVANRGLTWISRLLIEALTSPHEHMHCKSVPGNPRHDSECTGKSPVRFKAYREIPGTLSPLSEEHKDENEL